MLFLPSFLDAFPNSFPIQSYIDPAIFQSLCLHLHLCTLHSQTLSAPLTISYFCPFDRQERTAHIIHWHFIEKEIFQSISLHRRRNIRDLNGNYFPSPTILTYLPVLLGFSATLMYSWDIISKQGKNVKITQGKDFTITLQMFFFWAALSLSKMQFKGCTCNTQEDYKDIVRMCREKIWRAKA